MRKDSPEPRRQAAAAVEVPEQRPALALALTQPEQLGIQRVCRFARGSRPIDRVGGAIQNRPMLADEVLPGRFVAVGAPGRKR